MPDRPLRVLHLVCSDAFAGVERYLTYTAPALRAAGLEVTVAGGAADAMRPALEPFGVRYMAVASPLEALKLLSSGAVRRHPPDVVHVHMTEAEVAGVVTKPIVGRPVVTTLHFARRRGSSPLLRAAWSALPRFFDAQIAISDYVARVSGQHCIVVPTGVPDRFGAGQANPDRPLPERGLTVLVAQRFEPEKRTAFALEAWVASGLAADGWVLRLVGGGSEEAMLRAAAARLGAADSVEFAGFAPDLAHELHRAGILLAPCAVEGFGIAVVEAMSCELPVVAAAAGGHLETLGPVPGHSLFAPDDADGAGRELRRLASDAQSRAEYATAQRQRYLAEYTAERHAQRLVALYRAVVGGAVSPVVDPS